MLTTVCISNPSPASRAKSVELQARSYHSSPETLSAIFLSARPLLAPEFSFVAAVRYDPPVESFDANVGS